MTSIANHRAPPPGSLRAWLLAARPATLFAAIVPVGVGTACAWAVDRFQWLPALAALLGATLIQVGTNFANDLFDFEKGADTEERLGPTRVVQAKLLTPRQVRFGMVVVFGSAITIGLYLTWVAGFVVVAIGTAAIISGILYTAGPYPLGYHGLGDLFVMIFFGFVAVCGTTFVQAGVVPEISVWSALPIGALATAILVVNNVRDRESDLKAGKRTLAVRLGRRGGIIEFVGLLLIAYAIPAMLVGLQRTTVWVLLPLLTLPWAIHLVRKLATMSGSDLNATLTGTAKLMLTHGLLFAAGLTQGVPT